MLTLEASLQPAGDRVHGVQPVCRTRDADFVLADQMRVATSGELTRAAAASGGATGSADPLQRQRSSSVPHVEFSDPNQRCLLSSTYLGRSFRAEKRRELRLARAELEKLKAAKRTSQESKSQ